MNHANVAVQALGLILAISGMPLASASDSSLPVPAATLELSVLLPEGKGEPTWVTVAYSSENTIAVGLCRCEVGSLSLVQWQDGKLWKSAQTFRFEGVTIHSASEGRLVTVLTRSPNLLYSADLSTSREIAKDLGVSPSGRTVAEGTRDSGKVSHLTDTLELIREGTGSLQSFSDELLVIQDGKTLRTETLDGQRIGSFSLPSRDWGHPALLGKDRLYIDDCTKARIVDFNGKVHLEIHPKNLYPQGSRWFGDASVCGQGKKSSSDGRRLLFDFATRKVPRLQHLLEDIHTISTLGMSGPEDVNGEEVRVIDTNTGRVCFSWRRSFPGANWLVPSAAISPSGNSVAIAAGGKLSIYRLPDVCTATVGAKR